MAQVIMFHGMSGCFGTGDPVYHSSWTGLARAGHAFASIQLATFSAPS